MMLFVFILGFASCIINANVETIDAFSIGVILQRSAVILMMLPIYAHVPRARAYCMKMCGLLLPEVFILSAVVLAPEEYKVTLLWLVAIMGLFLEFALAFMTKKQDLIPINIEHSKDRLGVFLLIMVGETVISSTIEYRNILHEEEIEDYRQYYWVLLWALVLVFTYVLIYFAMDPPPAYHAFRRSILHGCSAVLAHKLMCGSVLAVGVAVKLMIEAVVRGEEMDHFAVVLTGVSVGLSLVFLFSLRLLHYFGVLPRGTEPLHVIRLMNAWWCTFACATLVPFIAIFFNITDPVYSMGTYAVILFSICLVETIFIHVLHPYVAVIEEDEIKHHEHEHLKTNVQKSYETVK